LTNRAGTVTIQESHVAPLQEPLDRPCYYTHYRMMVDHNGDVLLCPHDWGKKLVAGNLHDESILAIWTGKILTQARKRLGRGDRGLAPCNVCDVEGTRQGGGHFKAWQDFYRRTHR
jgi:radical SAM protein with 4Fe4S-binding SPASM domain